MEARPHPPRRDKGTRLMTGRDRHVLQWIAEQYAVRLDHVQRLLSFVPGEAGERLAPGPGELSPSGVLKVVTRWERPPAWAHYKRIYTDTPGWIWTTPSLIEILHSEGLLPRYSQYLLHESRLAHLHGVNCVRLDLARRHPEYRWVSERALRKQEGRLASTDEYVHIPDGEVWIDGERAVAVEVELSPKSAEAYDVILEQLLVSGIVKPDGSHRRFCTVWYFVRQTPGVHAQVIPLLEGARARLPVGVRAQVQIIDLDQDGVL